MSASEYVERDEHALIIYTHAQANPVVLMEQKHSCPLCSQSRNCPL